MGGGYKDSKDSFGHYWLRSQPFPMQRFYSGATAVAVNYSPKLNYYINAVTIVVGQMSNSIYFGTSRTSSVHIPILSAKDSLSPYPKYNLLDDITKDAILDLLPESWLMYMKNEQAGYDCTKYVYQYNHDDLVADGIEQS